MKRQTPTWRRRRGLILAVLVVSLATSGRRADGDQATEEQIHAATGRARSAARPPTRCAQQYPLINDDQIQHYLDALGNRLVEAAPRELNNPAFQYSFTPVNLKEINAFALPGGPMFVNRGMIEAADTEGEVAGVMAHELATCCCVTAPRTPPRRRASRLARLPAPSPAR